MPRYVLPRAWLDFRCLEPACLSLYAGSVTDQHFDLRLKCLSVAVSSSVSRQLTRC